MTEIYRNSVANIAAEAAANCHAGLFVRREGKHTRDYILDGLRIADSPSQDYLLVPVACRDKIEDGPLRKRGWAFQERLLAPRQISFGSHQVIWRCSRFTACEFFPSGYPTDLWTREHIDSDLFQCLESDRSIKDASGGLWSRIAENYTKSALTREEDKLVAIQGTAKSLRPIPDDDYLAGLWRKSLTYDLLWQVKHGSNANPRFIYRPMKYRAPTLVLGIC